MLPSCRSSYYTFCSILQGLFWLAATTLASSPSDDSTLRLSTKPAHEAALGKHTERQFGGHFHGSQTGAEESVIRAKPGPWGDLEYYTVYLEATSTQLKASEIPTYDTEWNFVGYTDEQVAKLFESTDMPAAVRAELLDRSKWRHREKMVTVVPSTEAILGLTPEARVAIYSVLTPWEEDTYHHEPVVIFAHSVREWLEHADLPEEVVTAIEKTSYHRGKNLVFADTPLVLRMVQSEEGRLKIRKVLTRTPTLVVNLRVTSETDVTAVANYWGGPQMADLILPFLEGVAESGNARTVSLSRLLPPAPRQLLYTYPTVEHGRTGYYPDCHWTSLNFRNPEPLDRLGDPTMATQYVLQNYTKVQGPYRYSDVIFLLDATTGNAIHSCVYLADDLVFTKNGRSPTQPWVVMKLDEVVTYYGMFYATQLACYRRNGE